MVEFIGKFLLILFIVVIVMGINYYRAKRQEYYDTLNYYRFCVHNIPVVAMYLGDETVEERAREEQEWLDISNNEWNIEIVPLPTIPTDKTYCDYIVRIGQYMEMKRDKRNSIIEKNDPDAYKGGVLNQRGVIWKSSQN